MLRLSEAMKNEVMRKKLFILVYVHPKIITLHSEIHNILKESISLKHPR